MPINVKEITALENHDFSVVTGITDLGKHHRMQKQVDEILMKNRIFI